MGILANRPMAYVSPSRQWGEPDSRMISQDTFDKGTRGMHRWYETLSGENHEVSRPVSEPLPDYESGGYCNIAKSWQEQNDVGHEYRVDIIANHEKRALEAANRRLERQLARPRIGEYAAMKLDNAADEAGDLAGAYDSVGRDWRQLRTAREREERVLWMSNMRREGQPDCRRYREGVGRGSGNTERSYYKRGVPSRGVIVDSANSHHRW